MNLNSASRLRWSSWLLTVLACSVLMTSGARAESPAVYMQRVQKELLSAQRQGGISAFANVLRQHMDVPAVGMTALGPHAHSLPKDQRPTYFNGMINFIAKYAANTAPEYPVASAVVTGQGPGDNGGTYVDSHITLRSGSDYDVRWLVVKSGTGYKVRDAQVVGFWMTSFLNNMFQDYIDQNGGNPRVLVMALNK